MRLFVGIAIAEDIRQRLAEYVRRLQEAPAGAENKWVRPESLHVTLKFIGETQKLVLIESELRLVASKPITMGIRGVGFFTTRSPRIFWAGVTAGSELEELANTVDERLYAVGVPREPHTYHEYQPHLTLARAGSGRTHGVAPDRNKPAMQRLVETVSAQPAPDFGTMTADEFILFRSETLADGSRYTPLAKFQLK